MTNDAFAFVAPMLDRVGSMLDRRMFARTLQRAEPSAAVGFQESQVDDDPLMLRRACQLAIDLQQHLFATLYHAIALQTPGASR